MQMYEQNEFLRESKEIRAWNGGDKPTSVQTS